MNPRSRKAIFYAGTLVTLTALWAWKTGYLFPEPSLDVHPAAVARGEAVFKGHCFQCHEAIPIGPRVAGWTPEYAYDAIAHLPELRPAMPPFKGTEQERADLAVWLAFTGARVPPDQLLPAEHGDGEWQPPPFAPPAQGEADPPLAPPAAAAR